MPSCCAIITAAGRCRRMGRFKPLLPIGDTPAILHMLDKYFASGVSHAVIVTGYQADRLKEACSIYSNITYVHNPGFLTNEMFDSIRLGLSVVPEGYDELLFTPVDIPFVSKESIRTVIETPGDFVLPTHNHRKGHPLKISRSYLPGILEHDGTDGLRGAFNKLALKPVFTEVDDPFILNDMDTPEAYESLLKLYLEA